MKTIHVEFDARFQAEAYPNEEETVEEVLNRGDFQNFIPSLLQWRTYELDDDGNPTHFGEWQSGKNLLLMKFYE